MATVIGLILFGAALGILVTAVIFAVIYCLTSNDAWGQIALVMMVPLFVLSLSAGVILHSATTASLAEEARIEIVRDHLDSDSTYETQDWIVDGNSVRCGDATFRIVVQPVPSAAGGKASTPTRTSK